MLNISENPINEAVLHQYPTYHQTVTHCPSRYLIRWVLFFFVISVGILFLPWTQNIRAKGYLTTLRPEDRPQSIYATISGSIDTWYVREGDLVKKGDTIAHLSEVKSEYFDEQLLDRTQEQVQAKNFALQSYQSKAQALDNQVQALIEARDLKVEQCRNKIKQAQLKITSDSMELQAAQVAYEVSQRQFWRIDTLYKRGIKSLTETENYRKKMQEDLAKQIACENKLLISQNVLINSRLELNTVESEYADKIAKSSSDRFSTMSDLYDAKGNISKLQNQYANYERRAQFYYIIAPQDGYVTKILRKGLGEIVKEGEAIVTIMPADYELAVELYINPVDYPLLQKDQKVRFIFDGWPAFVFSGWQGQSFGTFGGRVVVIDNMTNEKGKYRILVAPDPNETPWPPALRVGSGADGMILMQDVPLWYEMWRQLNGFPADYYDKGDEEDEKDDKVKLKAPANHLKK